MPAVQLLVDVLGPVVLLIALGAFAGPRLDVDLGSLSRLAYWVFGPAFVFDLFTDADLGGATVARLAAAGLAGMGAAVAVSWVANRVAGTSRAATAASALSSAYGNVGNAGLAITVFALGDEALPAAGVLLLVVNVVGVSLGVGLAAGQRVGVLGALRQALLAPMTVAAGLAVLLEVSGLSAPLVADRAIGLAADVLIPLMLFTLGLQLAASGVGRRTPDVAIATVAKLAVAPAAAHAVGTAVGLSGDLLAAATIQSAMPAAVFTMLVALEHDLAPDRVTTTLVVSTLGALVTLPVVLLLVA